MTTTPNIHRGDFRKQLYDHQKNSTHKNNSVKEGRCVSTNSQKKNREYISELRNSINFVVLILSTGNGTRNAGGLTVTWSMVM